MEKILLVEELPIVSMGFKHIFNEWRQSEFSLELAASFDEMETLLLKGAYKSIIVGIALTQKQFDRLLELIKMLPSTGFSLFANDSANLPCKKLYMGGMVGVMDKNSSPAEILEAVKAIVEKRTYASQQILLGLLFDNGKKAQRSIYGLSTREMQIANMLAEGKKNQQISNLLNLRPNTISTFKNSIFKKLQVSNITELMRLAPRFG